MQVFNKQQLPKRLEGFGCTRRILAAYCAFDLNVRIPKACLGWKLTYIAMDTHWCFCRFAAPLVAAPKAIKLLMMHMFSHWIHMLAIAVRSVCASGVVALAAEAPGRLYSKHNHTRQSTRKALQLQ